MRIIYLGTSKFAVPTLKALIEWPYAQVIGLVTQIDKPSGRGRHLVAPPTKVLAQLHNIPVYQSEKVSKAKEIIEELKSKKPDILVMVSFGQILKKPLLQLAPYGVINLHASLLPHLRGAAPINWAIINGDKITGNTTMYTDAGLDTGDILLTQKVTIGDETNAIELAEELSKIGSKLVIETLEKIFAGTIERKVQDHSKATYAPILTKDMSIINWHQSSLEIHNKVRGLLPWPGTQSSFLGKPFKILKTRPTKSSKDSVTPGLITNIKENVIVSCGENGLDRIELLEVQPANKKAMSATSWANGYRLKVGDSFS